MKHTYDKDVSREVDKTMHEYKHEGKFRSRKQALAVGLARAREKGEKVPQQKQ